MPIARTFIRGVELAFLLKELAMQRYKFFYNFQMNIAGIFTIVPIAEWKLPQQTLKVPFADPQLDKWNPEVAIAGRRSEKNLIFVQS